MSNKVDIDSPEPTLSHTDAYGKANMVDIANKRVTRRVAQAKCRVFLGQLAFEMVHENKIKKVCERMLDPWKRFVPARGE